MIDARTQRTRERAAHGSLVASIVIFAVKVYAWWRTGSAALLTDALESVVNIIAAAFALYAIRFAATPPDREHPYGHGKIEYLSAAFEGGLVGFAAITIGYAAVRALIVGPALHDLDVGVVVAGCAALMNAFLGVILLRVGRRVESPTLIADGHHVLSDVYTTVGAIVAVVLVRLTGVTWIDPVMALLLALLLLRTGWKLVVESASGLLDTEDPHLLDRLVRAFNECDIEGVGGVHHLRAIRSGNVVHVDAHVYVPEDWSVARAHVASHELERAVKEKSGIIGEIALHLDVWPQGVDRKSKVTVDEAKGPAMKDESITP
jgi:cation diffusion facilitator family transporter